MDAMVVLCTVPDADCGAQLARGVVELKLAACVNMLSGLRSFYFWDGETKDEPELLLLIKTRRERFDELAAWLGEHHPYDVPEIVALPIVAGSESYLGWIAANTAHSGAAQRGIDNPTKAGPGGAK
jgi:periplasmic divalent cation tolerance protein